MNKISEIDPSIARSGWIERTGRVRLEIGGPDRAKFLHNLVTADVKRLAVGSGTEAFVTSPQGKVLAYVTLLAGDSSILLRTDPVGSDVLLAHLRKYGVFDDATIDDRSNDTCECHLFGPQAGSMLDGVTHAEAPLSHASAELAGVGVRVVREDLTGRSGFTLIGPIAGSASIRRWLGDCLGPEVAPLDFEAHRIEAGIPVSGVDVTPNNLPQEVGRDARAINFVKGCYLGQETVARLDALGHVNKILKGIRIEGGPAPAPGSALTTEDGKAAGSITSAAMSGGWASPVALGYIRVAHAAAGTRLRVASEGGEGSWAIVTDLPMLPPGAS